MRIAHEGAARMKQPTRAWSLTASLLLFAAPAFANGSLLCEGLPYSAEVQFRLSTGELTGLIVARTHRDDPAPQRFVLRQHFADARRQVMRIRGTGAERPHRTVALSVSKSRGTLSYGGVQHRLRCDWDSAG
jgi:hypothetical protein